MMKYGPECECKEGRQVQVSTIATCDLQSKSLNRYQQAIQKEEGQELDNRRHKTAGNNKLEIENKKRKEWRQITHNAIVHKKL